MKWCRVSRTLFEYRDVINAALALYTAIYLSASYCSCAYLLALCMYYTCLVCRLALSWAFGWFLGLNGDEDKRVEHFFRHALGTRFKTYHVFSNHQAYRAYRDKRFSCLPWYHIEADELCLQPHEHVTVTGSKSQMQSPACFGNTQPPRVP